MVIYEPALGKASQVDFNTVVPQAFDPDRLCLSETTDNCYHGGPSVTVPMVVPGLLAAHTQFGKIPLSHLLAPAVCLARNGFTVGPDLARSLAWAYMNHHGLNQSFKNIFFRKGFPLRQDDRLYQPELARSLELIASEGAASFRRGAIVDRICDYVAQENGVLSHVDFENSNVCVAAPECAYCEDAVVFGSARSTSGFGIVSSALAALQWHRLGSSRGVGYVVEITRALREAWSQRQALIRSRAFAAGHTTHTNVMDESGMVVSLTFTHGPLWFGSGLVAMETGVLLNSGGTLIVGVGNDGQFVPVHNMSPVILVSADGSIHAIGSPGGSKIPAIVFQAIVDVIAYGTDLREAINLPRVSVDLNGNLEVEPQLANLCSGARIIDLSEYYGPASALSWREDTGILAAVDRRFSAAVGIPRQFYRD